MKYGSPILIRLRALLQTMNRPWNPIGTVILILLASSGLWGQNAWIKQPSGVSKRLEAVVSADSQLVAIGAGGTVVTSPDGFLWTPRNSGVTADLKSLVWNGLQFVAVGSDVIIRSTDGIHWVKVDSLPPAKFPVNTTGSYLNSVTWADSQFVAVGLYGVILTSPDGVAWTAPDPWGENYRIHLYSITWTGDQLVAVGERMSAISSPNGTDWTVRKSIDGSPDWSSIIWADTELICVGSSSVYRSVDTGKTWVEEPVGVSGSTAGLWSIVQAEGRLITMGPANQFFVAYDGINWTRHLLQNEPLEYMNSVVWTGTHFVAVGRLGVILTSTMTDPVNIAQSGSKKQKNLSIRRVHSGLEISVPSHIPGKRFKISLYDMSGQKKAELEFTSGQKPFIPLDGIGRGVYTLKVSGFGESLTQTISLLR